METLITMTGWVGTPVEFRLTKNNVSYASFRLASTPRFRRGPDWVDGETTWMTVTAWRALAEHLDDSIGKGEPVIAIGKIRTQNWVDNDGVVRDRIVLEATTVGHDLSLGSASFRKAQKHRAAAEASYGAQSAEAERGEAMEEAPEVEADDDDAGADRSESGVDYPSTDSEDAVAKVA